MIAKVYLFTRCWFLVVFTEREFKIGREKAPRIGREKKPKIGCEKGKVDLRFV